KLAGSFIKRRETAMYEALGPSTFERWETYRQRKSACLVICAWIFWIVLFLVCVSGVLWAARFRAVEPPCRDWSYAGGNIALACACTALKGAPLGPSSL